MGENATLAQFGATIDPPRVRKRTPLTLGNRMVGYICYDIVYDRACYVSERDSDEHRYRGDDPRYEFPFEGGGYGLSIELFDRLHGADVARVYIAEPDTSTVYQYGYQQFVDGTPINMDPDGRCRGYEKDPQKVVPVAAAVEEWPGLYPQIYAKQPGFK